MCNKHDIILLQHNQIMDNSTPHIKNSIKKAFDISKLFQWQLIIETPNTVSTILLHIFKYFYHISQVADAWWTTASSDIVGTVKEIRRWRQPGLSVCKRSFVVAKASRQDGLHLDLERQLQSDSDSDIKCCKNCVSSYTSCHHSP